MAEKKSKGPRARLFIALDLPEATRAEIAAWGRRELADPALRPVARESLHVTLVFLGDRPEPEIGPLAEVVGGLQAVPLLVALGNSVAKPSRQRPGLFALTVDSPGAVALQAELGAKLVEKGLHKPAERPFWPHVTVARVRSAGRGSRQRKKVESRPGGLPQRLLGAISCVRVTLYRSELQPLGARYTPLAQVELSEDGRQ